LFIEIRLTDRVFNFFVSGLAGESPPLVSALSNLSDQIGDLHALNHLRNVLLLRDVLRPTLLGDSPTLSNISPHERVAHPFALCAKGWERR
jgi:hypothetical protein